MVNIRARFLAISFAVAVVMSFGGAGCASAATPDDLSRDADQALHRLYQTNPVAMSLSRQARAILVFPKITKAGFIFGGAYGEGVLKRGAVVDGYYNSFTASWGLQAGAQTYGYAVFLMTGAALEYIHRSHGWEIGVGPTLVVVDEGVAKNLSTTTLQGDAYAFIFDQQGLMAGVSFEGTKISETGSDNHHN
jgi:lipid-binding SYLF domain-containing protein